MNGLFSRYSIYNYVGINKIKDKRSYSFKWNQPIPKPFIHETSWIHPSSVIIGNVNLGKNCSIWPLAVVRGDVHKITIGESSNIQDGTVIHCTGDWQGPGSGYFTNIGSGVTVGHKCLLHGCTIEDNVLVGMGSIVLDGARIEENVILGAGSLVTMNKVLKSGLWIGRPATWKRDLTTRDLEWIRENATRYFLLSKKLKDELT